ncbi:MAG: DUF481 domain-containing protein [Bacteroidetes bacterium]|nr:DUF481 domain-containing protein [Bacteroidota bacterium]MCB0844755.1 DUF481 domain-containing protein [Bacteroidota bacterium]
MKILIFNIILLSFFPLAFSQSIPTSIDTTLIDTNAVKNVEKQLKGRYFSTRDSLKNLVKTNWRPRINYNMSLSFDFARGNLNLVNFLPKTDVLLEVGPLGLNTSIGYNFAQLEGVLISNDFIFDVIPIIGLGDNLHLNGIVGAQAASIRNIDHRQKTGLGLGLPFENEMQEKVNLNINGVHERTNYASNDSTERLFTDGSNVFTRITYGLQLGSNGQLQLGNRGVQLSYNTYMMKAINMKEDFRISAFTTLLIPIGKKIFFQTNINYSYENVILTGTKHHDLFVSFGIGVARKQKDEKKSPT